MIQVFAGYDPREAVGYHTFCASIIEHTTEPVSITPLHLGTLQKVYSGGARDGTNAFIYSRFLIPYLMGYQGFAIFMDGADMVVRQDLAELWAMRDPFKAVQVVKHDYKTKNPRKYVGTKMEADNADYPCKNWSSVMLINCAHYNWRQITPATVEKMPGSFLHRFEFIEPRYIGELTAEWNWLCDEYGTNDNAKVCHYTCGIPAWPTYSATPMAEEWHKYHNLVNKATE